MINIKWNKYIVILFSKPEKVRQQNCQFCLKKVLNLNINRLISDIRI